MKVVKNKAFSPIKFMMIFIIIACFAAISSPVLGNTKQEMIDTEMIAGLTAIRNAATQYYTEHGAWPPTCYFKNINSYPMASSWFPGLKLRPEGGWGGSLDGDYFSQECYWWTSSET